MMFWIIFFAVLAVMAAGYFFSILPATSRRQECLKFAEWNYAHRGLWNAAGVNKGTGLVNLGSRLGIKREEIMAFGDGDNDTVMLKEVGFGVAMANGEPQVKEAADYITLSNEEDGVAQAIERFVLGGGEARC